MQSEPQTSAPLIGSSECASGGQGTTSAGPTARWDNKAEGPTAANLARRARREIDANARRLIRLRACLCVLAAADHRRRLNITAQEDGSV